MNLPDFTARLADDAPDLAWSAALCALWHDANDDWDKAHDCVQANTTDNCWVHAYLHRKEGDQSNADYWYQRASRDRHPGSLSDEWQTIAAALCT
jgi:hypothetical protein